MSSIKIFLMRMKGYSLNRRRIVITTLLILLLAITYLNFGSSVNDGFDQNQDMPEIKEYPSELDLPTGSDGQFNYSSDFSDFPSVTPPSELFDPSFNLTDWEIGYNATNPITDIPSISIPSGTIPTISFPSISRPTIVPPTLTPPTLNPPTGNPTPTFNPSNTTQEDNVTKNEGSNFTLPNRENKARNLPRVQVSGNLTVGINFNWMDNLFSFDITTRGIAFLIVMIAVLYLNKKFLPELLRRMQDEVQDYPDTQPQTFFVNKKSTREELERKKQRLKKLFAFNDHVDEIIENSRMRMSEQGPTETIITGYHDLDEAFSVFARLLRTKDLTPLEHAHVTFETGEIDNSRLEEIVNLFYYARFGHKPMTIEEGWEFIDHLIHLVKRREIDEL